MTDSPGGGSGIPRTQVHLGIACPMANERETAVDFARAILAQCQGFAKVSLFVVLDTVSTDGTREALDDFARGEPRLRVVWAPENRSVVDAYVRGYREALAAGCDWILEIDAGFSHQPEDAPKLFARMDEGFEAVFGTRFALGGAMRECALKRVVLSRAGGWLGRFLLGIPLSDPTSGFELFRRDVLEDVLARGIRSRGPFFQTEIKFHCRRRRIAEVPILYRAASHAIGRRVLADALGNLMRLFALRLRGAA